MEDITLIRDEESDVFSKILFGRPISRLQARKIGLLAGKHAQLKKINDIYQIILAMNHDIVIVAEAALKTVGVPAEIYLQSGKKIAQPYSNSDEAIELLGNCNYIVVGMDIEISSRLQIFLEKSIKSRNAPIVFTSESIGLFKISPQLAIGRNGDIFACNTKSLIDLASYLAIPVEFKTDAGIYNKANLLKVLAKRLRAHIVCIEDYQVLSCSYTNISQAIVSNITNPHKMTLDYHFIAVLLCLLCDVPNPENDMQERLLTAGYLVRQSIDNKKDFVSNLKNSIQQ